MKRRWWVALTMTAVLGLGAFGWVRSLSDGVDYSGVSSIRNLPAYQDPTLMARALTLPVASQYVAAGLEFQRNASFCGPASVVGVLRSWGLDVKQANVLDGTGKSTWFGLVIPGATLDDLAGVLGHHGRKATIVREVDLAGFRALMAQANDPSRRYIVNFHRGPLFGWGGGHHSPIGGYLADRDLVLVLDVNKRFQAWLVPTERLFAAVQTTDKQTGQRRGLLVIE